MLEGSLHVLDEFLRVHHAADLHNRRQHGGVGEVLAQLLFGDFARVDGAHPALVALQQGAELFRGLAGVDDDGPFFLKARRHVHGGDQRLVHHDYIVRLIDVGVDRAPLRADAVVRRNGRAHALRAVLREALDVFARVERRVRQQKRGRLRPLAPTAVPADFYDVFHALLAPFVSLLGGGEGGEAPARSKLIVPQTRRAVKTCPPLKCKKITPGGPARP